MSQRYYLDVPLKSEQVLLSGSEARHLVKVMRAKAGDQVILFDGTGVEFTGLVTAVGRAEVQLTIVHRAEVDREPALPLTIGAALPKGERQRWLVEKLVECGATTLVPLRAERGVAQPVDAAVQRLRRSVVEASKQCGRNRLMTVAEPMDMIEFLGAAPEQSARWFAHTSDTSVAPRRLADHNQVFAAVGPEGGWTEAEVAAAVQQGWQVVSLGRRVLRLETAALALAITATLGEGVG